MQAETNNKRPTVLTCWKDIANYLGKGVRTVQRWEQEFGLPVRRPNGVNHKSAVIAHTTDLDAWLASRWLIRDKKNDQNASITEETSRLIRRSQQLRDTHSSLLHQSSAALKILVESCQQLVLYDCQHRLISSSPLNRNPHPAIEEESTMREAQPK
jgi:hypothetical protein